MEIIKAEYLISSPSVELCPKPDRPEYAFLGRSNVGKSSLINLVTSKKELAKVSRTPGKTQLINHFSITSNDKKQWYLVDLPGYGFAKVSQSQRKKWEKMIQDYIRKRENLANLFMLVDSRHEPQQSDIDFINQLGKWNIPFAVIFTKADKSTQKEAARHVNEFMEKLSETWEAPPAFFVTSAVKHIGQKGILKLIAELNQEFENAKKKIV